YSDASKGTAAETPVEEIKDQGSRVDQLMEMLGSYSSFLFFGALIGLLPMWNGAVFIGAVAVLSSFVVLFPWRRKLLALLLTAGLVAVPQVMYLKTGAVRESTYSLIHWGYTIDHPTIINVLKYLGFTFGFKWLFIGLALIWMSWFQRRVVIAVFSLLAVAFLFQFSEEVLANHKFLNIWLIIVYLFVAYGVWRLWQVAVKGTSLPTRAATVALVILITLGGIIDLVPIRKAYWAEVPFEGDPLIRWTQEQTDPRAVFLTDRFVTHQILLAGRSIFYGWPYYTWGAGYRTSEREAVYRQLFQERNPDQLLRLLTQNHISYVAIDDGIRRGDFLKNINEAVYENYF